MKFSVVIPLYNKEHYIEKTIRSVLDQTCTDYEVIVVDDGSKDNSLALARKFESDRVRVIAQENQGVSVARNTGILNANGEFIAFLDADDEWRPEYLQTIAGLTDAYPESAIFVTAYAVNMGSGKINISTRLEPETGCLPSYWLTLAKGYDFVWTSATTIRRQALMDAGLFKPGEKIGQDLDMWARVARINPRVAYSNHICVNYNRAAEQNARTRVRVAWAGAFLKDLEEELVNPQRTPEEKASIQHKYDKKMTVFIFTAILAGEKERASKALKEWKGERSTTNRLLRTGLRIAKLMPAAVNRFVFGIRMKVF
ncbi:MAG: glycosyltransferase family 2 protein [Ruminococcaceae bacterium]|nr:glycosyltransferase family 2 protein [Oscillospiraceae bacterium]